MDIYKIKIKMMLEKIIELASLNDKNYEIKDNEAIWKRNEKRDFYYRNALTKIHNGKWFVWNWSAFLFNFIWMSYRKMYIISFIYMMIYFFVDIFEEQYLNINDINGISKSMILTEFICGFLSGAFGNKFYYHHLKKKLEKGYDKNIYAPANFRVQTLVMISSFFLFFGLFYEVLTFMIIIHMLYDFIKTKKRFNKYIQEKNEIHS